ncbi:MAG: vitamin B12 dependent-methionine synthase activation domain-containing protein, partial [Melioribacteraceae bacterium]|nr:vitamin B12 dependent-methionine synthase activation domain-containing protein [Melioribacteraceae bacterium]
QFGYKILSFPSIEITSDKIIVTEQITFHCNKIIATQLKGIEGLVIFTATLGRKYDEWFKGLFNSNHPLEGYIADMIGSVAVESAVDILQERINNRLTELKLGCSNRYSPGYCNWSVSEQKKLFSFLPDNFCNIELTESSLMIPIKSVSGIIGYGKDVVKKDYACKICTQENCYLNKLKVV